MPPERALSLLRGGNLEEKTSLREIWKAACCESEKGPVLRRLTLLAGAECVHFAEL